MERLSISLNEKSVAILKNTSKNMIPLKLRSSGKHYTI